MARIALISNEHPNEAVASALAPRIAEELKRRGHEVRLRKIPFKQTMWGEIMKEKREVHSIRIFALGVKGSFANRLSKEFEEKGFMVYRLHNAPVEVSGKDPFMPQDALDYGYAVELPAVYREHRNPVLRETAERLLQQATAEELAKRNRFVPDSRDVRFNEFVKPFEGIAAQQRKQLSDYLLKTAHILSSKKAGLMDEGMVKKTADLIERHLRRLGL